jgi:hypothetical protein
MMWAALSIINQLSDLEYYLAAYRAIQKHSPLNGPFIDQGSRAIVQADGILK